MRIFKHHAFRLMIVLSTMSAFGLALEAGRRWQ